MKIFLNNLKMNTVATLAAMMITIAAMNAQQVVEQFVFKETTTAENQTIKKNLPHCKLFPKIFCTSQKIPLSLPRFFNLKSLY